MNELFYIPENMRKYVEKENIFLQRRRKMETEKGKICGKGKYFFVEEKRNREGKGGKDMEKKKLARDGWTDGRTGSEGSIRGPRGLQGVHYRKETGQQVNLKSRVNSPSFLV